MQHFILLITVLTLYCCLGCLPNLKDQLRSLQKLYKDVCKFLIITLLVTLDYYIFVILACIQCKPFDIATDKQCSDYVSKLNTKASCGFLITSFLLTVDHCAVASLSCIPSTIGNVALWGIKPK